MDNFKIDIVSEGDEQLRKAFALLQPPGGKAVGWKRGAQDLIFFWHDEGGVTPFVSPADMDECARIASAWLKTVSAEILKSKPDIDGSSGHGWRLYTDSWGRIEGHVYSFVAVRPEWALYGK